MADWRNRIAGSGEEPPDQLLANPRNFRRHPKHQQDALRGVLAEVGWVQDVIVNRTTGHLVDGHLRVELAMREGATTVPVKYVDLSETEEALVLATLDPLAALAVADAESLDALLREVSTGDAAVQAMLADLAEREGVVDLRAAEEPPYSSRTDTPVYEPSGPCPAVADLTDATRHDALLRDIDAADIDDETRAFLRLAATRHVVFDYRMIANFYAHATAEVQRLMEDSALVIVDYGRAVELGYVRLNEEIDAMIEDARATA